MPQVPQLDYEFFKTRVEPIFLKSRSEDHARCYVCHQVMRHGGGPLSLDMLPSGASFWTEEQSRHNFEVVSKLVVPGNPSLSLFLRMPLAPEAGGLADTHQGGRQFASEDDPDWKNMKAWGSRAKGRRFLNALAESVLICSTGKLTHTQRMLLERFHAILDARHNVLRILLAQPHPDPATRVAARICSLT